MLCAHSPVKAKIAHLPGEFNKETNSKHGECTSECTSDRKNRWEYFCVYIYIMLKLCIHICVYIYILYISIIYRIWIMSGIYIWIVWGYASNGCYVYAKTHGTGFFFASATQFFMEFESLRWREIERYPAGWGPQDSVQLPYKWLKMVDITN